MTNKEALVATMQISVPDNSLELALINAGIDGTGTYTMAMQEQVEKCAIPLLYALYTEPDIQEGGYQVSHPDFLRKVRERLLYLAGKYNMTDILNVINPRPTVTGKSVW